MFEIFKHNMRQFYYEYFRLPKCHYFYIFEKMYALMPDIWNDVVYNADNKGFIITDFIDPVLTPYSSREVAFFNASQVYVFWLPGAKHSGEGYVKDGHYEVVLNCGAMQKPLLVNVSKTEQGTRIQNVALCTTPNKQPLPGGYVIYSAIRSEIKSRIIDSFTKIDQEIQKNIAGMLLEFKN